MNLFTSRAAQLEAAVQIAENKFDKLVLARPRLACSVCVVAGFILGLLCG